MSFFSIENDIKHTWQDVSAAFPAVTTFVQSVEQIFPSNSTGAQKLQAVKNILEATWSTIQGVELSFSDAWPTLSALIGALVTIYNGLGLFKHAAATPTASAS